MSTTMTLRTALEGLRLSDYVGFVGSIIVVTQYLLSIQGKLSPTGLIYPLLNILGCVLIMYSLYYNFNPPSFFIEVFWSSVSAYGIVRYLRLKRASR